ncbi:MAG: hypothetical protein ACK50Q_01160, partial [Labrys sp. (in: a-proteobacteria)]
MAWTLLDRDPQPATGLGAALGTSAMTGPAMTVREGGAQSWTMLDREAPPQSEPWAITRGFASGLLEQNPEMFGEAMDGFGRLSGSQSLIDAGANVTALKTLNPEAYKLRSKGILDSGSFSEAMTALGETLGSGVASTLPSVATGIVGGGIGGAVAGLPGAAVGGVTGAASTSYVMSYGELYKALKDEGVDPQRAAEVALYAAAPIAALDAIPASRFADRLGGLSGAKREVARAIASRIAGEAAKGAASEGMTEAAQEVVKQATISIETGKPLVTTENAKNIAESAIGGALTGGAIGGVGGAIAPDQVAATQPAPPLDPIEAAPPPNVTPDDIASPIDTQTISEGKAIIDDLLANQRPAAPAAPVIAAPAAPASPGPEWEPLEDSETGEQVGWINDRGDVRSISAPTMETVSAAPADAPVVEDATAQAAPLAAQAPAGTQAETGAEGVSSVAAPGITPTGDGTRSAPIKVEAPDHVDIAAANVATPSDAQKEAGNYQKGHIQLSGMDISIETPKDGERTGTAPDGSRWSVKMPANYGYVKRTKGADGDQVDVYIGPKADTGRVFVIDQFNPQTGTFDEHKAVLGVDSREEALALYDAGFSDGSGPKRRRGVSEMPTDQFRDWAMSGDTSKPLISSQEALKQKIAEKRATPVVDAPATAPAVAPVTSEKPALAEKPSRTAPFVAEGATPEITDGFAANVAALKDFAVGDNVQWESKNFYSDGRSRIFSGKVAKIDRSSGQGIVDVEADTGGTVFVPARRLSKVAGQKVEPNAATPAADPAPAPKPSSRKEGLTPVSKRGKEIGKNRFGQPVFEDERGVRSYVADGIRMTEPVRISPTRDGGTATSVDTANRSESFKTKEESDAEIAERRNSTVPTEKRVEEWVRQDKTWAEILTALKEEAAPYPVPDRVLADAARAYQAAKKRAPADKTVPVVDDRERQRLDNVRKLDEAEKADTYGGSNKVFTADAAEKARELLRQKLKGAQFNSGIDPEVLQAGITLAGYHIEAGARKFADYAKAMIGDLGEQVRPFLRSWYEGVRFYPGFDATGMTPANVLDGAGFEDAPIAGEADDGQAGRDRRAAREDEGAVREEPRALPEREPSEAVPSAEGERPAAGALR